MSTSDPDCIFCKIVAGKIPSRKLYEDDDLLAFHDIAPWAPMHFLIIPKQHIPMYSDVTEAHQQLLGKMMVLAPKLVAEQGITDGFRTVINTGPNGGQEVYHLHVHVMGGARPWKHG